MEMETRRQKLRQEAERRWRKLGQEHPELENTIAFGRGLVTRYIDDLPRAAPVALAPEAARAKLAAGTPLLEEQDLDLDLRGSRRFFRSLCPWVGAQGEFAADARTLEAEVLANDRFVDELLSASLAGDDAAIAATAERLGVSLTLLQSLVGFTMSAALMETARALAPLLEGVSWERNFCPVCGGPPLLAELQGSEGQRMLRCATCGASWKFPRTRCVHCESDDPKAQHYFSVDGEGEKYRVEVCDRCHGYLKSVTSFAPTSAELLTIEDAALLHLDEVAKERGYSATPFAEQEPAPVV